MCWEVEVRLPDYLKTKVGRANALRIMGLEEVDADV
jgi:hypothetical protein